MDSEFMCSTRIDHTTIGCSVDNVCIVFNTRNCSIVSRVSLSLTSELLKVKSYKQTMCSEVFRLFILVSDKTNSIIQVAWTFMLYNVCLSTIRIRNPVEIIHELSHLCCKDTVPAILATFPSFTLQPSGSESLNFSIELIASILNVRSNSYASTLFLCNLPNLFIILEWEFSNDSKIAIIDPLKL